MDCRTCPLLQTLEHTCKRICRCFRLQMRTRLGTGSSRPTPCQWPARCCPDNNPWGTFCTRHSSPIPVASSTISATKQKTLAYTSKLCLTSTALRKPASPRPRHQTGRSPHGTTRGCVWARARNSSTLRKSRRDMLPGPLAPPCLRPTRVCFSEDTWGGQAVARKQTVARQRPSGSCVRPPYMTGIWLIVSNMQPAAAEDGVGVKPDGGNSSLRDTARPAQEREQRTPRARRRQWEGTSHRSAEGQTAKVSR